MSGGERRGSLLARIAGVGALGLAAALVAFLLLFSGSGGTEYRLLFESGGQLVPGNEVLVGGQPIGSVEEIDLTDDNLAEVRIEVDDPLPAGTTGVIRATSLSGIANRYVQISPGNGAELDDGEVIGTGSTTSPVDLDQLFDTFRAGARRALQDVIQGFAGVYTGRGPDANRTYEFLAPALSQSEKLFAALNEDQPAFTRFLTQGSEALGAIADRRSDLSSLVTNLNQTLGAIADENQALDRSLSALAPALRQANTTFVNLRFTLDALDPLVEATKPATRDLAPFLRELRPVTRRAVPVFGDLAKVTDRPGPANDLADALGDLPTVSKRAGRDFPAAIRALDDFQPTLETVRPYTPDLLGFVTKLGQATAYYDANGHYARVQPAGSNVTDFNPATGVLDPIFDQPERQFDAFDAGTFLRCPGAATQAIPGSNPFLDDGNLGPDDCNPLDVPPGR